MYRIGVDLGGTNIVVGLVDQDMKICDTKSCKTNLPRSAEAIVADIGMLCKEIMKQNRLELSDIASVGVGVPGTANQETGIIEYANNLGFDMVPFVDMLKKHINLPIYMDNDANAAAWGEYKAGKYDSDSFVMVTLGTGVGGGVVVGGKLVRGCNYAAGELGHTTIDFNGVPCNCGRTGCFEAYGSATALIQQTKAALTAATDADTVLWELCDNDISKIEAKHVFDAVAKKDELGLKLLDNYTTYLAEGLANIINIFQPAVLTIGGGVSKAGDTLLNPVREKTAKLIYSRNAKVNTKIIAAKYDNDAGIIGAALLEA
ncbi:MAG: ROK family protein [Lachnospiraceae bacterium]|nr:ROK family protein [Lachnospiraceae bacterium]